MWPWHWSLIAALAIAGSSLLLRLLTPGGALAGSLVGCLVLRAGGWAWVTPLITAFVSCAVLSKIRKQAGRRHHQRDAVQIFANGYIPLLAAGVVIANPDTETLLYPAVVASCATLAADTWATEWGRLRQGRTVLLTNWQPIQPGRSGGVSLSGCIGGLLGACSITASSLPWLPVADSWLLAGLIAGCGLAGMFIDSLLGASLQGRFRCRECDQEVEEHQHCGRDTESVAGWAWLDNDLVNALSIGLASGTAGVLAYLVQAS